MEYGQDTVDGGTLSEAVLADEVDDCRTDDQARLPFHVKVGLG